MKASKEYWEVNVKNVGKGRVKRVGMGKDRPTWSDRQSLTKGNKDDTWNEGSKLQGEITKYEFALTGREKREKEEGTCYNIQVSEWNRQCW